MSSLLAELGINWRLLLTQGVNFFVLLIALTLLVYRPLLKLMEERRRRIESGLKGAEEAERRLAEIETLKTERLTQADAAALEIVSTAERDAARRASEIVAEGHAHAEEMLAEAAKLAERKKLEELESVKREAATLVKAAIARAVELDPERIDDALVHRAVQSLQKTA